MPNKLIISETVENMSMTDVQQAEFKCEIGTKDTKQISTLLDTIEKDIQSLWGEHVKIMTAIEGLTSTGCNIIIKIEMTQGNMSQLKKKIWLLLSEITHTE